MSDVVDVVIEFINSEDCEHPSACFTETHICTKCRVIARQALYAERTEHAGEVEELIRRNAALARKGLCWLKQSDRHEELILKERVEHAKEIAELQRRIKDLSVCSYAKKDLGPWFQTQGLTTLTQVADHILALGREHKKEIADLQQQLEKAREVLKWYADPEKYRQVEYGCNLISCIELDAGTRARNAMEGGKI